ncbi:MAG: ferredoxin [Desulfobacteraceae bacterium]|jgi:ferredoxin
MKIPVVDVAACTLCMGCVEVCPQVFRLNEALGMIEVVELDRYSRELVDEAIKYCPEDAIQWDG